MLPFSLLVGVQELGLIDTFSKSPPLANSTSTSASSSSYKKTYKRLIQLQILVSDLLICVSLGLQLAFCDAQTLNLKMCVPYKGLIKPIFYDYKLKVLSADITCL